MNYINNFLKNKVSESREDNTNWCEATTRSFADEYWDSMKVEMLILNSIVTWEVFDKEDYMNFIQYTQEFKYKRYTDVLINNFKARFFSRGNQKL